MKKSSLFLVACSLWLVAVCVNGTVQDGANKLQKFLQGLETYQARFTQTLLGENDEELETSTGTVYLERPGKFRWHYTDPYSQYLISDGHTLWVYDKDLEQVTIRNIDASMENSPASILGGDLDIDKYYEVNQLGREQDGSDWVELVPRNSDSQYKSVRLGFRDGQLSRMMLFDSLGQMTDIRFSDSRRNSELDETLFHFEPPAGVDVIDSRDAGD